MEQLAVVVRLRPGAEPNATKLLEQGPPFAVAESGLERHTVYVSATEVIFVFEGHEVEWTVEAMVEDPFRPKITDAFAAWRDLVDGEPRIARPAFTWQRDASA